MSRIYLDTNVYIYYFEQDPQFGLAARTIFRTIKDPSHSLCASLYSLGELLVGPLKRKDEFRVASLRRFFHPSSVEMLSFTWEASMLYAELRATPFIKPLDALHLACAASAKVDFL